MRAARRATSSAAVCAVTQPVQKVKSCFNKPKRRQPGRQPVPRSPLSRFANIPTLNADDDDDLRCVNVVVETPHHTRNKYAFNEELDVFELRHTLRAGMAWPCDFGFVPQTVNDDGDPLDVALFLDEHAFPGCLVRARLLGSIGLRQNGENNDRLVACSISMTGTGLFTDDVRNLKDLPAHVVRDLKDFLELYSREEGNKIKITGISQSKHAMRVVRRGMKAWAKSVR